VTNVFAACAAAKSPASSSSVPSAAGLAAWNASISEADRASVARQAPSSTTFSASRLCARASVEPRAASGRVAASFADSAIPSEAAAWKSPALRLRSMYAIASPAAKPPRSADCGTSTAEKVTEWLPEARMPSASQSPWISTPGASGGICA
jgi:hypothetical protein